MVLDEMVAPAGAQALAREESAADKRRVNSPYWTDALAAYARPSLRRSAGCLLTSVVPYLALLVAMYFSLRVSVVLTLGLGVLAAGFLLRTYIVFHDCAHGSFLPSKRANIWLGSALGVLVYAPFHNWRHNHAVHHATAADLDRRGQGDVPTLTVAEYNARAVAGPAGLPAVPQPARDVRARAALRDDPRPAHRARATRARGSAAACTRPTSRSPC